MDFRAGLLVFAVVALLGCRPAEHGPTITTSGTGSVLIAPTKARLTIEVASRASTATEASAANDTRLARVLTMLRADSIVDSVRVVQVGVDPYYEADRAAGFEAQGTVEVLVRQLDAIGGVLDGALHAGATSVGRLTFESDSTLAGRREAIVRAFASARADAEALAAASKQRLGGLITASAGGSPLPFGTNAFEEASITTGSSGAEFGNAQSGILKIGPTPKVVVVTASVQATWQVRSN